jgi:hypothetical protein
LIRLLGIGMDAKSYDLPQLLNYFLGLVPLVRHSLSSVS